MTSNTLHIPVLLNEAVNSLKIKPYGIYLDVTGGRGGHSEKILSYLNDQGKLIILDADKEAIDYLKNKFATYSNVKVYWSNFVNFDFVLKELKIDKVDGILADLGVSSPQLDQKERGFSYHHDAKLDMRMNKEHALSAYEVVNQYDFKQLCHIFREYGEINQPQAVAKAIIQTRMKKPILTTLELVSIIKNNVNKKLLFKDKHPARTYFQAIRIAVNQELTNLEKFLDLAVKYLKSHAILSVITFHSLEDRIVKQKFLDLVTCHIPKEVPITNWKSDFVLVNKKPIEPSNEEIKFNTRSRSCKLRSIQKV